MSFREGTWVVSGPFQNQSAKTSGFFCPSRLGHSVCALGPNRVTNRSSPGFIKFDFFQIGVLGHPVCEGSTVYPPGKLTNVPWKSLVGRCISYWNSPFFRGHVSFRGCTCTIPGPSWKENQPCFLSFEACWKSSANSRGHLNVDSDSAIFFVGASHQHLVSRMSRKKCVFSVCLVAETISLCFWCAPDSSTWSWEFKPVSLLFNLNPHWSTALISLAAGESYHKNVSMFFGGSYLTFFVAL